MPFFLKKELFDEISNVLLKLFETLTTNSGASMKKMNCMCVCIYIYIYICTRFSKSEYPHWLFSMNKEQPTVSKKLDVIVPRLHPCLPLKLFSGCHKI